MKIIDCYFMLGPVDFEEPNNLQKTATKNFRCGF